MFSIRETRNLCPRGLGPVSREFFDGFLDMYAERGEDIQRRGAFSRYLKESRSINLAVVTAALWCSMRRLTFPFQIFETEIYQWYSTHVEIDEAIISMIRGLYVVVPIPECFYDQLIRVFCIPDIDYHLWEHREERDAMRTFLVEKRMTLNSL